MVFPVYLDYLEVSGARYASVEAFFPLFLLWGLIGPLRASFPFSLSPILPREYVDNPPRRAFFDVIRVRLNLGPSLFSSFAFYWCRRYRSLL